MKNRTKRRARGVAAAVALGAIITGNAANAEVQHPADMCQEDENYVAVHYLDPRGVEDIHGVSRACIPADNEIPGGAIFEFCADVDHLELEVHTRRGGVR